MIPISFLFALGFLLLAVPVQAQQGAQSTLVPTARYYVSVKGNDRWSGTLAAPNRRKNNGPFATLERARDALRADRTAGKLAGPTTVLVRGGTYFLSAPIVFAPEDSGTAQAPITFAGYPNETPVFSGGQRITGWKSVANRWEVLLPDVRDDRWNFIQLWSNGERRMRPRLPKNGYYFVEAAVEPSPKATGKGHDRFGYAAGEVRADWHNRDDVEFLMMQIWTMARMRPAVVDEANRVVTFSGNSRTVQYYGAFPKGNRYLIENVREALSEPGEWYLDRKSGVLSYIPRAGETMGNTEIIAPRAESLVQFAGDVAAKKWVEHIGLRGLDFRYTNWTTPVEGSAFSQAEAVLPGAIRGVGANDIALQDCRVSRVGTYAIEFAGGCHRNRIENCEITDMAAGGIKIGEMKNADDADVLTSHNVLSNNLIAHFGRVHPAAVGVWIGHSPYNKVLHNTIRDGYYTGISPGWSWGYGTSGAHHNEIGWNHISQIGQGVLSDMGGIYTLGVTPGTILHHNLIHDIQSFDYGGWGIYFDEGTTDIVAENNVVFRTKSAGFHQHYGKNNLVRNNIFAFGGEAQLMRTRPEEHLSFTLERNIILYNDRPLLGSNWKGEGTTNFALDNNLYWNIGRQPVTFAGSTLEAWQGRGQDIHSLVADPQFVDWQHDDFRLKPDSPALKLGFVPIDVSTAGRVDARGKPLLYKDEKPRAFPPPPGPRPIKENFESIAVGQKWGFETREENDKATVRVTDEEFSLFEKGGTKSLKFIDVPGQEKNYNPHAFLNPKFSTGIVLGRFDLRVEAGTLVSHEWRDSANPYHVGPSLRVDQSGTLRTGDRELMKLAPGTWVRIEIECALGEAANGRWHLKVLLQNGTRREWNDLPCSPDFRALEYVGFIAEGTGVGVFYIDNLLLRPGGAQ